MAAFSPCVCCTVWGRGIDSIQWQEGREKEGKGTYIWSERLVDSSVAFEGRRIIRLRAVSHAP